MEENERATL